jgi:hypothetical protein
MLSIRGTVIRVTGDTKDTYFTAEHFFEEARKMLDAEKLNAITRSSDYSMIVFSEETHERIPNFRAMRLIPQNKVLVTGDVILLDVYNRQNLLQYWKERTDGRRES